MAVTSENEHVALAVKSGCVAVAGVGDAALNEAGASLLQAFGHRVGQASLSAATHALVVSIEGLVRIFHDETVLHGNRGGGRQLSAALLRCLFVFSRDFAARRGRLLPKGRGRVVSDCCSAALGRSRNRSLLCYSFRFLVLDA